MVRLRVLLAWRGREAEGGLDRETGDIRGHAEETFGDQHSAE
jgi:hypothetical protein